MVLTARTDVIQHALLCCVGERWGGDFKVFPEAALTSSIFWYLSLGIPIFAITIFVGWGLNCSWRASCYFKLFGDKAPPTARHSSEVSRTWSRRCYPHTGNGVSNLVFELYPILAKRIVMDVAQSTPQGAHYRAEVMKSQHLRSSGGVVVTAFYREEIYLTSAWSGSRRIKRGGVEVAIGLGVNDKKGLRRITCSLNWE